MIERFITLLHNLKLAPSAEDVADVLWLAYHMLSPEERERWRAAMPEKHMRAESPSQSVTGEQDTPALDRKQNTSTLMLSDADLLSSLLSAEKERREQTPPQKTVSLHSRMAQPQPQVTTEKSSPAAVRLGGAPIQVADMAALPGKRSMHRALRPLKRKVPSALHKELDVNATVRRIADTNLWIPMLMPAQEPWLDVVLVVDAVASMVIWHNAIREIRLLLENLGAFRDVRMYSLFPSPHGNSVTLHPGWNRKTRNSQPIRQRELIDPSGQRLFLVMSDCVSQHWHNGAMKTLLETWGQTNLVTILHVLPRNYWRRSKLGFASQVVIQSLPNKVANRALTVSPISRYKRPGRDKQTSTKGLALPVITLEPESLHLWVQLIARAKETRVPGFVLPVGTQHTALPQGNAVGAETLHATSLQDAEELVTDFATVASPEARKLAGLFASVPLSLPVMRLVQQTMMPKSRQVHLAEVVLSGLLKIVQPDPVAIDLDAVLYEFRDPKLRTLLRQGITVPDTLEVLDRVSEKVLRHRDKPFRFRALLAHPELIDEVYIPEGSLPFANIAIDTLADFGETELAKRLGDINNRNIPNPDPIAREYTPLSADNNPPRDPDPPNPDPIAREHAPLSADNNPLPDSDPNEGITTLPPKMVDLPAGSFVMGSSKRHAEEAGKEYEKYFLDQGDKEKAKQAKSWPQDEINDRPVHVAGFALACYPVTNAQYALFMKDGGYDATQPWWDEAGRAWLQRNDFATEGLSEWQQRKHKDQPEWWDDENFGKTKPNHPVVGVSWYEAMAFCRWLSQHKRYNPEGYRYRLPTEAEWEYAARGSQARRYPWGKEAPSRERANYNNFYKSTTPVDSFPLGATPEGIYDMAGNVWEWTGTIYKPYPYNANDGREQAENPAQNRFVLRGGGWADHPVTLRASYRNLFPPDSRTAGVGFRLARLPSWER